MKTQTFSLRPLALGMAPLFLALFLTNVPALRAQTLLVPAQYPSIQKAVDAAQEGDTVLVSPGIYYENLQLRGRNIVLTSRYALERNPALIEQTVVDGSKPAHPDTASCLLVWKGETAATVVQGFTFRNGAGTVWLDPAGAGLFREGGGILTEAASPVIRHNIIRDNVLLPPGAGMVSNGGGGIRCGEGAPLIENNRIVYNRGGGYGGGIVLNFCPDAVVRNNVIAFNSGGTDFSGGGFWATGLNTSTVVTFQNNVVAYNESPAGTSQFAGKGGGIWVFSIKLRMRNNIVWGNKQVSGKQVAHSGAAIETRYNCVEGGYTGPGNIMTDPLFADTLCFMLSPGSPCADAGDPDAAANDLSHNSQVAAYPARSSLRNDMGAYGGPAANLPMFFNPWANAPVFSKVTNSPVVTTAGDSRSVNWIDIDGDKDLDLFISNGPQSGSNNFLYRNNGTGGFTRVLGDPIVLSKTPSDGATWADYDNDGDNDCFVVNWYGVNNLFFKNKGNGSFDQITTGNLVNDGGFSETASWGDYDNDGLLDLYVTNSGGSLRNFLYRNQGDGTFAKITSGDPVADTLLSRCVNWTDVDNDGDLDLFVTNEKNQNENLYRNNAGVLTKETAGPLLNNGGKTMSASWGDYDNDGDNDVYLANDQANDALFRNDGNTFAKIGSGPVVTSGGNTFSSQWADVDNDGDLDLFATNAFWGGAWKNFLFLNNGDGTFVRDNAEVPATDQGWSYGCAFGDMDRDGDLDLAVANCQNETQNDYLYENHSSEGANHWLVVECIGTTSNKSAIGAKVRVRATINGKLVEQLREINAQSGYCGQNQLAAHFGLADAATVESVQVQWPSGLEEIHGNIAANQYIALTEAGSMSTGEPVRSSIPGFVLATPRPNPFSDTVRLSFETERPMHLAVTVSDLNGRTVHTLADRAFTAGAHTLQWDGAGFPSGAYTVSFRTGDGVEAKVVVKKD